jgi:hypothetical protein
MPGSDHHPVESLSCRIPMHVFNSNPTYGSPEAVGVSLIIKSHSGDNRRQFPDMLTRFLSPVAGVAWRFRHTILAVSAGHCCALFASLYS